MIIAAIVLVSAGIGLMCHHYQKHGYWFDWSDLDCHEVWVVGLFGLATGIAIGSINTLGV